MVITVIFEVRFAFVQSQLLYFQSYYFLLNIASLNQTPFSALFN
jgi:hypothetical protein